MVPWRFVKLPNGSIVYANRVARFFILAIPFILVFGLCSILFYVLAFPDAAHEARRRAEDARKEECHSKGGLYTNEFARRGADGKYRSVCIQLIDVKGDK